MTPTTVAPRRLVQWIGLAACLVALTVTAGGSANTGLTRDRAPVGSGIERLSIDAFGQTAARQVVLRRSDLSPRQQWVGGLIQPQPSPHEQVPCAGSSSFVPKQSDIVVRGFAESDYRLVGSAEIDAAVQIVDTPNMAEVGWRRWAQSAFLVCLKTALTSTPFPVTVRRLPFPPVGSFTAAYRAIFSSPGDPVYGTVEDTILIASGCARLRLTVTTDLQYESGTTKFEDETAQRLAERATQATTCVGVA
jgi:hypothetical protein